MVIKTEILIIGAGILGCFAARSLRRFDIDVTVIEKREDVCTGITRANTGIIYQGYDQHPGSLKARLCRKASEGFVKLCSDLDIHYRKTGLLMLSFGSKADAVLNRKIENGRANGISNLKLLDRDQVYDMEPNLRDGIRHALYSENTFTVNPWEMGIAAFENAASNGAHFYFNEEVLNIRREHDHFEAETGANTYIANKVLCCAGFNADNIWEMVSAPQVRLIPLGADYIIFDKAACSLISHVISVEPENKGEGLTLVPTADGNILAGPTRRPIEKMSISATVAANLAELEYKCSLLLPSLPMDMVIRNFATARPNPYYTDSNGHITDKSINDFVLLEDHGFFDLIGVKTPGITCADELGKYTAEKIISDFERKPGPNNDFDPKRSGIIRTSHLIDKNPSGSDRLPADYSEIICRCECISKGEILEAIRRGATTVDGIKRRTGAGMGRCQGGYCMEKILHILSEELVINISEVTKDGGSGYVI